MPLVQPPCAYRLIWTASRIHTISMSSYQALACAWTRCGALLRSLGFIWSPPPRRADVGSDDPSSRRAIAQRGRCRHARPPAGSLRSDWPARTHLSMAALAHHRVSPTPYLGRTARSLRNVARCASSSACVLSSRFRDFYHSSTTVAAHADAYLLAPSQSIAPSRANSKAGGGNADARAVARYRRAKCARTTLNHPGGRGFDNSRLQVHPSALILAAPITARLESLLPRSAQLRVVSR